MYMFWCVSFIVITCGYGFNDGFSGEYWPGSYYTIDQNGNQAKIVPLNKDTILRYRRNAASGGAYSGSFGNGGYGGGYSSGGSGYSGGHSGGGGPDFVFDGPTSDIAGMVQSGLDNTFNQLRSLAGETAFNGANGGGGGRAYSGSFSSGGPGSTGQGGVLHSRFAATDGGYEREYVTGGNSGIQASSSAQGPHGAFSFSSSSTDENGRVSYQTRARKF